MSAPPLTPAELALLKVVRESDEDHGGLDAYEVDADEIEILGRLCDRGLVEASIEFGEAPDGEEDEREMGGRGAIYRITGAGVAALRDD